uniref:uncharacterized protein LOC122598926 n=1 Tax=Erigeron canadensis TaxID=72917 RepID=UPI001CB91258|nr:uncharacterized protein LOC122598926 [Erigeron canadensis]
MTESDNEDVESNRHQCQIAGHQHNNDRPSFMKKLTEHSFTTKMLTVPNHFVRTHSLDNYTNACVYVGRLKFKAKLDIMYDGRKDGDQSHVVLITDWWKVSKKTGVAGGKELRFELNVVQSVDGPSVEFHVC